MNDRPHRRWFRFRLRTLLVLVVVLAIPLAWVANERRQSGREVQIALQMRATGGALVSLSGRFDRWQSVYTIARQPQPQDWWRGAAQQILGRRITSVAVWKTDFKDVRPLARLRQLRELHLVNLQLDDLTPLAGCANLQDLILSGTPVTDEQFAALQKSLPNCEIVR